VVVRRRMANLDKRLAQSREAGITAVLRFRYPRVSWVLVGIVYQRRRAETRTLLVGAGLQLFAEQGFELVTLDDVALAAGFTKGAIYRHFPSKGAFLLALFEQYAAVARAGAGARRASWFIPLTLQFAAQAVRDPLLRRRFAVVLSEAPEGPTPDSQLLRALARLWPA
jgi:AcrR family transcriptional regulator